MPPQLWTATGPFVTGSKKTLRKLTPLPPFPPNACKLLHTPVFLLLAEETFDGAMQELVSRGYLGPKQLVALVMSGRRPIWRSASTHSIQV